MGIATDIKKLGEDIIASYDFRVKAVGELVSDVHETLKGFSVDRKNMSNKQAKALSDFMADLTKDVSNMIKGFQKEHKAVADELRENLEKGEADREKGEADRLKSCKNMMGDIRKGIKDIETYVAKKLKEFDEDHADMSEELKKELAKYVTGVVRETKQLLGGFAVEREKMADSWQALTGTMAKRRNGKPVVSASANIRTVKEVVKKSKKQGKGKKRGRKKGKEKR